MGIHIGKKHSISIGGSSGRWTPNKKLGGELPSLWIMNRTGLNIPDIITPITNDVKILTPTLLLTTGTAVVGVNTRSQEHIFDGNSYTICFKAKQISDVLTSGRDTSLIQLGTDWTGGVIQKGICIDILSNIMQFAIGDDNTTLSSRTSITTTVNTTIKNAGWIDYFIEIDKTNNQARCSLFTQNGVLVGLAITKDIAGFTFNNNNNALHYAFRNLKFAFSDFKKFLGLKTLSQCRDASYVADVQMYLPDIISGTDVSGNALHFSTGYTTQNAIKYYSNINSYCLDYGYSIYQKPGQQDVYSPNSPAQVVIANTNFELLAVGFKKSINVYGDSVNHNLYDSLLEFTNSGMDRSDTNKWNATCRASIYYDAANPKRWHITEINKIIMNSYSNTGYEGMDYPKFTYNSFDERKTFLEFFSYNTNKAGIYNTTALKYTGDQDIPNILSLSDPYNEVIKITALSDSEFRFNVNDQIVYKRSDVFNKIDAMLKLNPNEDKLTTILRYIFNNTQIHYNLSASPLFNANIINSLNSYNQNICAGIATFSYNIIDHYFPNDNHVVHAAWDVTNNCANAFVQFGDDIIYYKGRYIPVPLTELQADNRYIDEPIRIPDAYYSPAFFQTQAGKDHINGYNIFVNPSYEVISSVDNLSMKMPETSTFIFPVRSTNIPKDFSGGDINQYANGIITIPSGITGIVSMPYTLLQINGTGNVTVDSIEYNLPTDFDALKAILQGYVGDKFYNEFVINENGDGIEAEYLINQYRTLLFKYNKISKGIISGDISYEKVTTAIPVTCCYLAINKGDAESWTLTFDKYFRNGGQIKIPIYDNQSIQKNVTFYKYGNKQPLPYRLYIASGDDWQVDRVYSVNAGLSVIDKCFASDLIPRVDSFVDTLELSFVTYDGSSCYFTLDGSTPDATKTLYTVPFTISATTTIKWINIKTDYADSHVNSRILTKTA